ncbi:hypothetical protein [Phormidesmis priestleyi]|uniref:hypothetical protein n=1 Tax=Phormidesmis priestleyi TaxID=268141 RepID=UPI0012E9850D|nr:hypothetical protein [Phormidesmis priestleyi]
MRLIKFLDGDPATRYQSQRLAEDWDINMILVLRRVILTISNHHRWNAEVAIIDRFVVL